MMLSVFFATLSPMLVMLLCVFAGFFLNKASLLPKNSAEILSKLETYIFVPSLIIKTFFKYCTVSTLKENYRLILYCVISLLFAVIIAYILSPFFAKNQYEKNIYRYAFVFSNFSFLGNSIVPAILGEENLFLYMLYTLPLVFSAYSWGTAILIPLDKERKSFISNLKNPVFFSIVIGLVFGLFGISKYVPSFLFETISYFSSCMGPVAMLLTGFVIGNYNVIKLIKNIKVFILCILKLSVIPSLFVFILFFIGADKQSLIFTFFAFGTALGLNTVIFPSAYGGDASTGASMAIVAQLLCVITIPVLYTFFQIFLY